MKEVTKDQLVIMDKLSKMTDSERLSYKRKTNVHGPAKTIKYKIGEKVIGKRSPDAYVGELLEVYVTKNHMFRHRPSNAYISEVKEVHEFRNMAYKIKCDVDGKTRSFQAISKLDNRKEAEKLYNLK